MTHGEQTSATQETQRICDGCPVASKLAEAARRMATLEHDARLFNVGVAIGEASVAGAAFCSKLHAVIDTQPQSVALRGDTAEVAAAYALADDIHDVAQGDILVDDTPAATVTPDVIALPVDTIDASGPEEYSECSPLENSVIQLLRSRPGVRFAPADIRQLVAAARPNSTPGAVKQFASMMMKELVADPRLLIVAEGQTNGRRYFWNADVASGDATVVSEAAPSQPAEAQSPAEVPLTHELEPDMLTDWGLSVVYSGDGTGSQYYIGDRRVQLHARHARVLDVLVNHPGGLRSYEIGKIIREESGGTNSTNTGNVDVALTAIRGALGGHDHRDKLQHDSNNAMAERRYRIIGLNAPESSSTDFLVQMAANQK